MAKGFHLRIFLDWVFVFYLYKPSKFNSFPISHQHLLTKSLLLSLGSLGSQIAGHVSTSVIRCSKSIFSMRSFKWVTNLSGTNKAKSALPLVHI